MKVSALFITAFFLSWAGLCASSTNLENIYGKNDLDINGNYAHIYGNNFGSIIVGDDVRPRCMDVETAEREINLLKTRNAALNEEIADCERAIDILEGKVADHCALIEKIDDLLSTVTAVGAELYTLSMELSDPEMKMQLQVSVEESRQQKYDLENRRVELNRNLTELKNRVAVKKRFITVNNIKIRRNMDKIDYFKACAEMTLKDNGALGRAVRKSSELQAEVDALLGTEL